jgi:hypothetical protein
MGSDWALPAQAGAPHKTAGGSPRRRLFWICRKPSSMGASHQRSREAPVWARRSAGRARRSWRSPIAADSPSRFTFESATPHEVTLVHATLAQRFVKPFPVRLIRGQRLRVGPPGCRPGPPWRGTDRPAPQNTNIADPRRSPAASLPTEVEDRATLCLVPEFRRLVVRYERYAENFLAMLHLAC